MLDLGNIQVNGGALAARGDDGVHLVGYLADASGDGAFGSLDLARVQGLISSTNAEAGLSAYPTVDPVLVADINASGGINSADLARIQLVAKGTSTPLIPAIPAGMPPLRFTGPDPKVWVDANLTVRAGQRLTIPVKLDTAEGLESVKLKLRYDPKAIKVIAVRRGSLTQDFGWFIDHSRKGYISIDMSRLGRMAGGEGDLILIEVRIKPGARGAVQLDLEEATLNESRLTLNPAPQPGIDVTDGTLVIEPKQKHRKAAKTARIDLGGKVARAAERGVFAGNGNASGWQADFLAGIDARPRTPNSGLRIDLASLGRG